MFANFIALSLLPLADATAFTFATPLLVVPLAAMTLGETVRPYRWAAVGLGFVGVLVMLSDDLGQGAGATAGYSLGAAVALAGAFCSAVAMIQTRRLTRSEATGAIVFYFSTVTAAISAALLILAAVWPSGAPGADFFAGQKFVAPSALEFCLLVSIGLLGGAGQILMTHCYRFADASIIAAFDYVVDDLGGHARLRVLFRDAVGRGSGRRGGRRGARASSSCGASDRGAASAVPPLVAAPLEAN